MCKNNPEILYYATKFFQPCHLDSNNELNPQSATSCNLAEGLHCLRDCPHSLRADFNSQEIRPWIEQHLKSTYNPIFPVTLWWCCHWRNANVLRDEVWPVEHVLKKIECSYQNVAEAFGLQRQSIFPMSKEIVWMEPPPKTWTGQADGVLPWSSPPHGTAPSCG